MRSLSSAIVLCVAAVAAAQPRPCNVARETLTFDISPSPAYVMHVSVGGGPTRAVEIDTGSTGIAVWENYIPKSTPATDVTLPKYIEYNSSSRTMYGKWVHATVKLSDCSGTSVTIPRLPVLAVNRITCPKGCGQTPEEQLPLLRALGMMGVGFDRGAGMGKAPENPFLHLPAMETGAMQRGYVITSDRGVTLGMSPADLNGFRFLPLQPVAGGGPFEWQQARGCVSIAGGGIVTPGQKVCGNVLMDTGVDTMYLTYLEAPAFQPTILTLPNSNGFIWQCPPQGACTVNAGQPATVTVTWPDSGTPAFQYPVTSPQRFFADKPVPNAAHVHMNASATSPVFVNTSRQLLYTADYLYDATCGRIGFRPKQ
jgi:hypothetical protein